MGEGTYKGAQSPFQITTSANAASGEILQLSDGRAGVVSGLNAVTSGDKAALVTEGLVAITCAAATTFAVGDRVYWDASADLAIQPSLAMDGSADFYLGLCAETCTSSQAQVKILLNLGGQRPFVYEFDCATGSDTDAHVLIPAEQNQHGLILTHGFGIVTEAMVGSSEDQGIITVSDESDNALFTLTPSDAAADAIGDYILGVQAQSTATGAATILQIAAGEFVDAAVTQQTAGTPAGKVKVFLEVLPLL